jgi:NAD(P)-dependent dehydrogenase (short-subunit alcohol dehydrogenase family)
MSGADQIWFVTGVGRGRAAKRPRSCWPAGSGSREPPPARPRRRSDRADPTYGGQAANPGGSLYSAGKFGIERFTEALAKEIAPFGIGVTIVERGGTRTGFRRGAVFGTPLAAYDGPRRGGARAHRRLGALPG